MPYIADNFSAIRHETERLDRERVMARLGYLFLESEPSDAQLLNGLAADHITSLARSAYYPFIGDLSEQEVRLRNSILRAAKRVESRRRGPASIV